MSVGIFQAETHTFDYEHRLTGVGANIQYAYDGIGNLLAETDAAGTVQRYYLHGQGLLAMATPAGASYCYHFNPTGSTVVMTDQSQAVVNKYAYDPFGANINQDVQFEQPFKYVGQYGIMTESNGFYYMRARYYDPQVGRFIAEDPLGFDGGDLNLYAYVGGNPITRVDPAGLTWESNARLLGDFVTGGGNSNRFYGPDTIECQEMQNSPGAAVLRNEFYNGNGNNVTYGTVQAAKDTLLHPSQWSSTALQVGGFAGASAVINGDGTATFTIQNVAGASSFFYHAGPNISATTGPFRSITQTFKWTEKYGK